MSDFIECGRCLFRVPAERWSEHVKAWHLGGDPHPEPDNVNSPGHYTWLPVEAIEITERFDFCVGNALKYLLRHQHKGNPVEDLKKARWYIDRAIKRAESI